MCVSREKRAREGGCSSSMPCSRSSALSSRASLSEEAGMESRRSRQVTRWVVTGASLAVVSLPACLS
jgi:hypothetical protein